MARVFTLSSGSNGNCTYVGDADGGLLVDAGISFQKIKNGLEENGILLDNIKALLITHEHSDHIKGLPVFIKKTSVPVYASEETAKYICGRIVPDSEKIRVAVPGEKITADTMSFEAFEVFHDAAQAVGYRIITPDDRTVVYSTDVGHIDDKILKNISFADFNIIESNYDEGMLMCNVAYPFLLRKRISGDCGHLSNSDCAKTVVCLAEKGSRRFLLAHLSEQNNTPKIALEAVLLELSRAGYKQNVDFEIEVAPRNENSRMLIF